jgi:hypothetical protein
MPSQFCWNLLAGDAETIKRDQYEHGFHKLAKKKNENGQKYLEIEDFEPRAELFFKEIRSLRVNNEQETIDRLFVFEEEYKRGWDLIQEKVQGKDHEFDSLQKAEYEKHILVTPYHLQMRFKKIHFLQIEALMEINFVWFWVQLQHYLEVRNKKERRTINGNYNCRGISELASNMQIFWHHLFSDAAFERLDTLIRENFRRGSFPSDIIIAKIYSSERREAVRQECEPILKAVAEEFSFNYDPELDRDDNFRKFVPKINRCMQAICPATQSLLHGKLEYYWLLLPKANLLEFMRSVMAFERSTGGSYPFTTDLLLGWDFPRTIQLVKSILQTLRRTANLSDDLDEDTKAFLHEVSALDASDCCGINLDENPDDLQAGVWATDAGVWTRNPYIVLRSARPWRRRANAPGN